MKNIALNNLDIAKIQNESFMARNEIIKLNREITELKALVEKLQRQKEQMQLGFDDYKRMQNISDAEIKAQAVEDAINACRYCGTDGEAWRSELEQYVIKLANTGE